MFSLWVPAGMEVKTLVFTVYAEYTRNDDSVVSFDFDFVNVDEAKMFFEELRLHDKALTETHYFEFKYDKNLFIAKDVWVETTEL